MQGNCLFLGLLTCNYGSLCHPLVRIESSAKSSRGEWDPLNCLVGRLFLNLLVIQKYSFFSGIFYLFTLFLLQKLPIPVILLLSQSWGKLDVGVSRDENFMLNDAFMCHNAFR